MTKFEDNLSPYLTVVEQASTPANPSSGDQKLFVRTSDHVLCYVNSSGTVTPIGGGGSPYLGYAANAAGDQSITSATMAVLPTPITVTFTAPASGNVLVRLSATCGATNGSGKYQSWAVAESGAAIQGTVGESIAVRQMDATNEGLIGATKAFVLTGVSAGSHTYSWWAACSGSGGTFKANANTPAVMTVEAL